ncbi:MAG: Smr/MutS family endonuclease, partial [Porticoccaceae bacterium]|nr:Smr/MutS family endonuclease [Porticoccaceae bacterium]
VTHGKGEMRHKPALLKSCVNHWLRQLDVVLAFHTAQRHHGGSGATYVMLRKSDTQKDENRERHQTRRKGIS